MIGSRDARRRLLVAFALGLSASVIAYVALRLVEAVWFPEVDPAIVTWTEQGRFLWRSLLAAYLGGAAVFGGHVLASRSLEIASVWLLRATLLGALALALQGALVP